MSARRDFKLLVLRMKCVGYLKNLKTDMGEGFIEKCSLAFLRPSKTLIFIIITGSKQNETV